MTNNNSTLYLAPIVLFVYNRPAHTKQTVEALQQNELASQSELFIYSDAAKNVGAEGRVNEVRKYIKSIDGFKKVTIIERGKNWGLANSIIDGVTRIVNEYGKIIVLEDDLVSSPYFLKFMNEALEHYKDEKKVWHISGWNYPIDPKGLDDVFFWRLMNCWGWATWADRWQHYKKDVDVTMANFSKDEIKRFNLENYVPYWSQVTSNKLGKIDTWAVFWYVEIFKNDGLCLNPTVSYIQNIGLDGTGINCGKQVMRQNVSLEMNSDKKIKMNQPVKENEKVVVKIKEHLSKQKINIFIRIINKISSGRLKF